MKTCITTGCRLPGNVTSVSFDGTNVTVDPERGITIPGRMIQQFLDKDPDPRPVEVFGDPSPWTMHNQYGPVAVRDSCGDCGAVCVTGTQCVSCGCPGPVDLCHTCGNRGTGCNCSTEDKAAAARAFACPAGCDCDLHDKAAAAQAIAGVGS